MNCTTPGCDQPPVLQWQRAATDVEAGHAADAAQHTQVGLHKTRLTHATLQLIETRRQHADTLEAAKGGDHRARAILPTVAGHVAVAEQALTDLEAAGPIVLPAPETVTIAVFGCTVHAVTLDAATWTHQVGCLTEQPGVCACTPPVEE